jgi:hypothetical protein
MQKPLADFIDSIFLEKLLLPKGQSFEARLAKLNENQPKAL